MYTVPCQHSTYRQSLQRVYGRREQGIGSGFRKKTKTKFFETKFAQVLGHRAQQARVEEEDTCTCARHVHVSSSTRYNMHLCSTRACILLHTLQHASVLDTCMYPPPHATTCTCARHVHVSSSSRYNMPAVHSARHICTYPPPPYR